MSAADPFESAVVAAIRANRRKPFGWGRNDCALFAANIIREATGVDLAKGFRGRYRSEKRGRAIMAEQGWRGLADMVDAFLPRTASPRRGDVCLVRTEQDGESYEFLAVTCGRWIWGPAATQARRAPLDAVAVAWDVRALLGGVI